MSFEKFENGKLLVQTTVIFLQRVFLVPGFHISNRFLVPGFHISNRFLVAVVFLFSRGKCAGKGRLKGFMHLE